MADQVVSALWRSSASRPVIRHLSCREPSLRIGHGGWAKCPHRHLDPLLSLAYGYPKQQWWVVAVELIVAGVFALVAVVVLDDVNFLLALLIVVGLAIGSNYLAWLRRRTRHDHQDTTPR